MSEKPIFEIHEKDDADELTGDAILIFANGNVTGMNRKYAVLNRVPAMLRAAAGMSGEPEIKCVFISEGGAGDTYRCESYRVGYGDVTAIVWGEAHGIKTVRVFKHSEIFAEFPLLNVQGIYFQ